MSKKIKLGKHDEIVTKETPDGKKRRFVRAFKWKKDTPPSSQ